MPLNQVDITMMQDIPAPGVEGKIIISDGVGWTSGENAPVGSIVKQATDPTISDPATPTVGDLILNNTTGELFCCTAVAVGENVWKNAGKGTDDVVPNAPPTNPTNTGDFLSTIGHAQTITFQFAGATDPDAGGSVTHYIVDNIDVASGGANTSVFNVSTAEVAAGTDHSFVVGTIASNTTVSFRVRAKDDYGEYSTGVTTNTIIEPTISCEYLVIGGGGGGENIAGGGGGAGGYSEGTVGLTSGTTYTIKVAAGGPKHIRGGESQVTGAVLSANQATSTGAVCDNLGGGVAGDFFDGDAATSIGFTGTGVDRWITGDIQTAQKIQKYTLKCYNAGSLDNAWKIWSFEGSNNTTNGFDGDWVGLHVPPLEQTSWSLGEVRTFWFENDVAYRYYRWSRIDSQTTVPPNMADAQLFFKTTGVIINGHGGGGAVGDYTVYDTGNRTYWGYTRRDGGSGAGSNGYSGGTCACDTGTKGRAYPGQGQHGGDGGISGSSLPGGGKGGGGGGGGAYEAGHPGDNVGDGGDGGDGKSSSITGSAVTRAGGGGAGGWGGSSPCIGGTGGDGGGGDGSAGAGDAAQGGNGDVNTGSGGGGHGRGTSANSNSAGDGGSGVVYLKVLTSEYNSGGVTGGTGTPTGSYTCIEWTGDGSYIA